MLVSDNGFFFNLFCLVISFHMYILCYWGQRVTDGGRSVAIACSNPKFVDADVSFKKGLLLMMLVAQRSKYLTTGKFIDISLDTMVAVRSNIFLGPFLISTL